MRRWAPVLVALALAGPPAEALAFVVSGNVTDMAGNNLVQIRVDVFDEDLLIDDHLATTYTDAMGNFSINVTGGWGIEDPDVFVRVEWRWQLLPAADYSNAHVQLVRKIRDDGPGMNFTLIAAYTPKSGPVTANHPPANPLPNQNLQMNQSINPPSAGGLDDLPTVTLHINEALNFYRDNRGSVSWSWDEDVILMISTNRGGSFVNASAPFFGVDPPHTAIADVDINGVAAGGFNGFVSDIYHEMGHYVHYRFNGDELPRGTFSGRHNVNTESDPPFALVEGWPSYVGELTDDIHVNDNKYQVYRDDGTFAAPNSLWRGDEAPNPTGLDPTTRAFESGEDVEGALGGFWFAIDTDPMFTFEDNFRVMADDGPDHIFDFCKGFIGDVGAGSAGSDRMYEHMQTHGIVYNRSVFETDPFSLPQSSSPGSALEVSGVVHLRGTVDVRYREATPAELGVDQTIDVDRVRLLYANAADDLTGDPTTFTQMTPWGGGIFGTFEFDTTALADGEYDLVIQGDNEDSFEDNFLPTWRPIPAADPGDGNPAVDTEEKFFKVLGAWFDSDFNPVTDTIPGGKVEVDNTPPAATIGVTK